MERLGGGHVILHNWLRRFRSGAPLCAFSAQSWNRVANVLESIEGVGCRIEKTENGWGWQIVVDGSSDFEPPEVFESGGYPFGPRFNFGVTIDGAVVTIHAGLVYRGGVAAEVAETDVTITTDGDWIALKLVPGETPDEDAWSLVRWPDADGLPQDHDGALYRGLYQFGFANGRAKLLRTGWMPGEVAMMQADMEV
jgi:hypothetical protein